MKSRPILFSSPMIRALLEGRKTQTRRIIKPQSVSSTGWVGGGYWQTREASIKGPAVQHSMLDMLDLCPYGQPGDLLWVREACFGKELSDDEALHWAKDDAPIYGLDGVFYFADSHFEPIKNNSKAADAWVDLHNYRGVKNAKVPGIHMPRWASRLTLRITDVRVQRLNDIIEADALAEGCGSPITRDCKKPKFKTLWEQINGTESWGENPWVWAITFDVIKANIDQLLTASAPPRSDR